MTIILSLATAFYGLQVSDRLLSQKTAENQYEPWDPASNKSIIVQSPDGLISMGYTGPAHIAGARTDGWIAQVLVGKDLGASKIRPDFGTSLGQAGTTGHLAVHLTTVAERLNRAVAAGQVNDKLSIDYVGFRWQNSDKLAWPVFGRITWDRARGGYVMAMSKRRWPWESGRHYLFRASGRSQAVAQALLRDRLSGIDIRSKEQAAAALITVLRELPPHDPTVSKDCLVTTVQRETPHAHIKYEPYEVRQVSVAFTGRTVTLPAAFTPWIIAANALAAPQVISGGGVTHHFGGFDFAVEGSDEEGELWIMSSQPRRLWP